MNRQLLTVFKKEMRDMSRDRRALFAAFSFAIIGPIVIAAISFMLRDDVTPYNRIKVAVANIEQAPGLQSALINADYDLVDADAPEGIPTALPGETIGLIVVGDGFQEALAEGRQAPITLYVRETSVKKIGEARKLRGVVEGYAQSIAVTRLKSRGVPLILLQPLDLQVADLAEESFQAQYFGDFITLFLMMAPFTASMSVAIDTLAGERERNSLQSLLAQPISGWNLVLGKWFMVSSFGLTGTLLACITYFLSLEYAGADQLDITLHVSPFNFVMTVLIMLPLAMLVASLQMLISIQVKSFKEGQTYVSMLTFAPMFLGYTKIMASDKLPESIEYFPVFSHMASLGDLLFNNVVDFVPTMLSLVFSFVGIALCLFFTARFVDNERLLDAA